ncbi:hypothetical protein [uncultured Duncaniella sp.]|uniref:hypothetical protein n=1 Tax=uncultured Duncaniella sp. TaxID=2768039 RepID=UPI0025A9A5C9|nr:hypothetical protein [uncultured Duncaniella sp.]
MVKLYIGKGAEIFSIEELAGMEIPASEPNEAGVFTDPAYVSIPLPSGLTAVVGIARDRSGTYHAGYCYGTATSGGGFSPSLKWNSLATKEAAFLEGLRLLERVRGFSRYAGYFRAVRREYFICSYRQLELF